VSGREALRGPVGADMQRRDMASLLASRMSRENVELLQKLGKLADSRGSSAFIVGGVVRDVLLDIPNEDLDVVVDEPAEEFAQAAAAEFGGAVKAHTRFGTAILVLPGGRKIDLATARSEAYQRPGALPTVSRGEIEEDIRRRDFTINSMAVRINEGGFGTLVDLYSGIDDLDGGTLRVLTDHSFEDDPTRILRGVRFAARFGFEFDEKSERLLREAVREQSLKTVSGERLMNEIVLILRERRPWPPVARLIEWGVLRAIDGAWSVTTDLQRTFEEIERLVSNEHRPRGIDPADDWAAYLLAMLEPLDVEARERILTRLRAGRRLRELERSLEILETRSLQTLAAEREVKRSEIHRAASVVDPTVLVLAMATLTGTRAAERIALYVDQLAGVSVSVTGDYLVGLGVPEGPTVGDILRAVLDARVDGAVRDADEERALAERLAKNLDARNKN
jgi:tRNA nucleotidyltransferase (CCA-adding enzyme)